MKSLLTNVPIKRTVDIILREIHQDRVISTNLKKRTLEKLISGKCTKIVFSFNNKFYHGVSMDSSLGPLLANIIMTGLKDVIIRSLIHNATIKFCSRFVDDTLLVMKPENVRMHKPLNKFYNNLHFIVDMLQNEVSHYLEHELSPDGFTIFQKDVSTGLCVNFTTFMLWTYCTSWITRLVTLLSRISPTGKLSSEINTIKRFAL